MGQQRMLHCDSWYSMDGLMVQQLLNDSCKQL